MSGRKIYDGQKKVLRGLHGTPDLRPPDVAQSGPWGQAPGALAGGARTLTDPARGRCTSAISTAANRNFIWQNTIQIASPCPSHAAHCIMAADSEVDLYATLGVSRSAKETEVSRVKLFKRLGRRACSPACWPPPVTATYHCRSCSAHIGGLPTTATTPSGHAPAADPPRVQKPRVQGASR